MDSSFDDREKSIVDDLNGDQNAITELKHDLSLPLEKHKMQESEDESTFRKCLVFGVHWVSLVTENVLSHPFIVLRRQCQVHSGSQRYHLHPLTLLPSIVNLHRRQGVTTLWKGLGSSLLTRGLTFALDDVLSKLTSWPRDIKRRTALKHFGQHVLLKCISIGIVAPFYAASLVETVQSDLASEKPGLSDFLREGSLRLFYWKSGEKTNMLPAWAIVVPGVLLGIPKYLFNVWIRQVSSRIMRRRLTLMQEKRRANNRNEALQHENAEIYASLIASLTTEVIFFPFETILHRLQLQGTRTIIDNLDNGRAVVAILTNYQGAVDCYRTTLITEGFSGLYKGFGALVLQFAAHVAIIKLTHWIASQITELAFNRPPSGVVQHYNPDRGLCNSDSRSISSTDLDVHSVGDNLLD